MWQVRISHPGLNKFRVVRGVAKADADLKAALQLKAWNEQWQRTQATRARQLEREKAAHKYRSVGTLLQPRWCAEDPLRAFI